MKSGSSIIKSYLLDREEGFNFTVKELLDHLKKDEIILTNGAISGFCFKLAKENILSTTKDRNEFRYRLEDKQALSNLYVREAASSGSQPGVPKNHSRRKVPLTPQEISTRLMEFASEIEQMKVNPDLSSISTAALLKELMRREGKVS